MLADSYGNVLLAVAAVIVIGGLIGLWLLSRVAPKGTVLVVALAIFALSWSGEGAQVREVLLIAGAARMLGFGGIILGIVDMLRKRKTQPPAG